MAERQSKRPGRSNKKERRFSQEQYEMLLRCSEKNDMTEWNRWRAGNRNKKIHLRRADLSGAHLCEVNLQGADLTLVCLFRANLREANLRRADLLKGDLREADLTWADFRNANLNEANLSGANIVGGNLCDAKLIDTDFSGANLRGASIYGFFLMDTSFSEADLRGANLSRTELDGVNLTGADLTGADLRLAKLVRCKFANCIIDNAIVDGVHIHGLLSLPKAPKVLRLGPFSSDRILTGHEAKTFFKLPAIVEVYLTEKLSQRELACFNLHIADMHDRRIGTEIFLTGHRFESEGSILRFQGPSYNGIYEFMPDLLAPFRMARAIDWKKLFEVLSTDVRRNAITALAKLETRTCKGMWRFAEHMANFFQTYAKARVYQISEERKRGVRIDVYTDEEVAERLSRITLPANYDRRELLIVTGDNPTIQEAEKISMSNVTIDGDGNIIASGTDASVRARDVTIYKQMIECSDKLDADLKEKLKEAREAIEKLEFSRVDKDNVADELGKLTSELKKTKPDPSRARLFWNHIKEVAPTVASILQTAETIAKLLFP